MNEPLTSEDGVQFRPIRPTAARSLHIGDEILVPEDGWPTASRGGPGPALRGRITDIQEDETTLTITVSGELIGENGLFEKAAHPWEAFDRVMQPGDPFPGTESRLVRGDAIWKWLQVEMNDPEGSGEKYLLRAYRRVHDDEINRAVIEVIGQSLWNPKKTNTMTFLPEATIVFKGHR